MFATIRGRAPHDLENNNVVMYRRALCVDAAFPGSAGEAVMPPNRRDNSSRTSAYLCATAQACFPLARRRGATPMPNPRTTPMLACAVSSSSHPTPSELIWIGERKR